MGFGFVGVMFYVFVIVMSGCIEVVVIVMGQGECVQVVYLGVCIVFDFDMLFGFDDIECVVIVMLNDIYFVFVCQVFEVGCYVVVDKFVMFIVDEVFVFVWFVNVCSWLFVLFYNCCWDGDFFIVCCIVELGEFGCFMYFVLYFDCFWLMLCMCWCEELVCGGGLLFDFGLYLIDQVFVLFGMLEMVSVIVKMCCDYGMVFDFVYLLFGYLDKDVVLYVSVLLVIEFV